MRKLIVANIVSLDGYYEGPDANVMVLPMDATFDAYNVERLRHSDTLLLGRRSYDLFRGFWPALADDPSAKPVHQELARLENAIEKVVVSDTISSSGQSYWGPERRPSQEGHRSACTASGLRASKAPTTSSSATRRSDPPDRRWWVRLR